MSRNGVRSLAILSIENDVSKNINVSAMEIFADMKARKKCFMYVKCSLSKYWLRKAILFLKLKNEPDNKLISILLFLSSERFYT